ncbi:Protein Y24F12A.1 [Aphelenchoides avenae]|nr:Protein Y24F12A.1 [Aphelenchus avenae]
MKRLAASSSSRSANISGIKKSASSTPLYTSEQYDAARKPLLEVRNRFSFDPREIYDKETLGYLREQARSQPQFDLLSSNFLDSHFHPEDLTYKDHLPFQRWREGMATMKLNDTAPIFGGAVAILCNPTVYCQGVTTPPECTEQLDRRRFHKNISGVFDDNIFPRQYALGAVMGVHPKWAAHYNYNRQLIDQRIKDLASTAQGDMDGLKIVGIGETGFCFKKVEYAVITDDLNRIPHGEEQEKAFIAHMQLAKACALPLITHIRGGTEELTEQLEIYSMQLCAKYLPSGHVIIRHCFVRSARIAAMWRSHFPNVVFSHAPTLCDDRRNAAEKQTVTDFWLQHQTAESDAPHFFYDNKYLGNSGLVPRVYRKTMRLRRAETPEDRRTIQYYLTTTSSVPTASTHVPGKPRGANYFAAKTSSSTPGTSWIPTTRSQPWVLSRPTPWTRIPVHRLLPPPRGALRHPKAMTMSMKATSRKWNQIWKRLR